MLTKRCLNRKFLIQAVIASFIFGFIIMYYCPTILNRLPFYKHSHEADIINLNVLLKHKFYQENCFDGKLEDSLDKLSENLLKWSKAYHRKCQILWKKFHTIYKVNVRKGELNFPSEFIKKMKGWLGNNEQLFEESKKQQVIQVHNVYSHEQTVFNLLRSKRPVSGLTVDPKEYVYKLNSETKQLCDFCHYKTMTAEDIFGRIEGKYSASAANAFKLEKWHGLFLTKKHNPLDLTEEEFVDLFNTSIKWFNKAHSLDKESSYPMMVLDALPKGGASQFHCHAHGFLSTQYLSHMKNQHNAALTYMDENNSEYWNDVIEIHHALGLSVRMGDAVAISPVTPVREYEIIIFSNRPGTDLFRLYYYVVQTYYKLKRMCFSSGIAYPVMFESNSKNSLPSLVRVGTRGDCSSTINDISSLDLYVMQNVHVDPYVIIKVLKETVDLLKKSSSLKNVNMVPLEED